MLKVSSKLGAVVAPNGKLGIENIKEAFTVTITVVLAILDLIKKFNIQSALQLAFQLAEYKAMLPIFQQALKEFADLDVNEAKALRDHFRLVFNIENDKLEEEIEEGIDLIVRTYEFAKNSVLLFTDWKVYATSLRNVVDNVAVSGAKVKRA